MKWENVSIFISSTFQDMHGERDYLVKEIFPELLSWCESRRLHMYEIDLRWGITREDSTNRNTVAACLHNIDRCRPFFLCFLGQRRGWVPDEREISSGTREEYPALQGILGKRSVTEMEIEHALLSPMNRMYEGVLKKQPPCRRALFYFRTEDYLSLVPPEEIQVYRDSPENREKIAEYKKTIAEGGYPITHYSCIYEKDAGGHGRLGQFTSGGEELGQVILRQLKEQIAREFPDHMTNGEQTDESADRAGIQEEFIWREEQSYYPQKADLDEMEKYLSSGETKALCVTGRSGMGKTSLLCALAREYRGKARFIPRFCGVSPDTSDLYALLSGILRECGLPVPAMEQELYGQLGQSLQKIAAQESTVLLIDGLNQALDGLRLLELMPSRLPEGMKIILSCKEESLDEALLDKISAYESIRFWPLKTACDEAFKRGMIDRFLSLYLKKLDEDGIQRIIRAEGSASPLFISVILSELRVFGRFEDIQNQIQKFSGNTDAAFSEILARLDSESPKVGGVPLSRLVFGLLACSRNGLSEEELLSAIALLTDAPRRDALPALRILLRQVRPFLARRGRPFDFFHESFRFAAAAQYAADKTRFHAALADTFRAFADPRQDGRWSCPNARPLTEYPYHLSQAQREDELQKLLLHPRWIRRKMRICGLQPLLADFDLTQSRPCALTGSALKLSAQALMEDDSQLAAQLIGRLCPMKEEFPEIGKMLNELERRQKGFWLKPVNGAFTLPGERDMSIQHGKYPVTALCVHLGELVCADEANRIGVYSRETGERLRLIVWNGASVRCFATDGKLLYAGCGDGTVPVWQTQNGSCCKILKVSDCAVNSLTVAGDTLRAADEAGYYIEYSLREGRALRKIKTGKYPLLSVAADQGRVCFGGMNQKAELLDGKNRTVWKTGSGYIGKIVLDGDRLVYSTFYPRLFFRNLRTGAFMTTDYTDGYDFALPDSTVMKEWRKKGPYIRDMIHFQAEIAVATPFSVAVFPMDGAAEPLLTFPCHDARALAFHDGVIYVGSGKGSVYSYKADETGSKEAKLPNYPIVSIAREGTHLAVAHETIVDMYETGDPEEGNCVQKREGSLDSGIPGFFTDVVPWKDGFAAGSFCEHTRWKKHDENDWHTIHQSMLLRLGESTSESPLGTEKMIPLRDHLVFLTRGHEIYLKSQPGNLSKEMLEKATFYKRMRVSTADDPDNTSRFHAVAACSDTAFAAASWEPEEILKVSCDRDSFSMNKFPVDEKICRMEGAPDGLLYAMGADGVITCWDPRTGKKQLHPETRALLQIKPAGKPIEMAVSDRWVYVSLAGGWLEVFDRETGEPCHFLKADSDVRSLCVYHDRLPGENDSFIRYLRSEEDTDGNRSVDFVYAGTENGRLMVFAEENAADAKPCRIPAPLAGKEDDAPKEQARERNPAPVMRCVPPDQDSGAVKGVRIVCSFAPLCLTILAILLRKGWPGLVHAFTMGADSILLSIIMGVMCVVFMLMQIALNLVHLSTADLYYEDTRRWLRSDKLPVLDRFVLPLLYLALAVPGIILSGRWETLPAALTYAITVPFMVTLIYFQGVDLFQGGTTKKLSRDKTFISMEEVFWNLRLAALVLGFLFAGLSIWAAAVHPEWLAVIPR